MTYRSSSTKSLHELVLCSCHCCTFYSTHPDWGGGRGLTASQHAIHHEPVADVTNIRYTLEYFIRVTKSIPILHQC